MRATLGSHIVLDIDVCGVDELRQEEGAKHVLWSLRRKATTSKRMRLFAVGRYIRADGGVFVVHAGEIPELLDGWVRATVAHACKHWGEIG